MSYTFKNKINTVALGGTSSAVDMTGVDLLAVIEAYYTVSGVGTITDNQGNTYTAIDTLAGDATNGLRTAYKASPTVSSSMTFTAPTSANLVALGYSGAAASPLDGTNHSIAKTTGTSLAPGSKTPSEDNCLVVVGWSDPSSGVGSNGDGNFTSRYAVQFAGGSTWGYGAGDWIQTTASASNPTISWSGSAAVVVGQAAFKAAAGGGSVFTPYFYRQHIARAA